VLAVQSARRCLPPVLAQLEQDSGLALFHELSHLPPSERLAQAFAGAQRRYQRTPEHDRTHSPRLAISGAGALSSCCRWRARLRSRFPSPCSPGAGWPLVPRRSVRAPEWMVGCRSRGVELTEGLLEHWPPESAGIATRSSTVCPCCSIRSA
jgi:hypothetical protein